MVRNKIIFLNIFLVFLFVSGCSRVYVKDVQVDNTPLGTLSMAELKGVPADHLQYFKEVYPPETWQVKIGGSRVAVGPILISEEAMLFMDGDSTYNLSSRPESGTSKDMVTVRDSEGQTIYFKLSQESFEAQAVVVEEIANSGNLKAIALDKETADQLANGTKTYKDLRRKNIRYYINGNLVVESEQEKEIRVYLRMLNSVDDSIICAVSAKGSHMDVVSRKAALILLKRIESIL